MRTKFLIFIIIAEDYLVKFLIVAIFGFWLPTVKLYLGSKNLDIKFIGIIQNAFSK